MEDSNDRNARRHRRFTERMEMLENQLIPMMALLTRTTNLALLQYLGRTASQTHTVPLERILSELPPTPVDLAAKQVAVLFESVTQNIDEFIQAKDDTSCSICIGDYEAEQMVRVLPCGEIFIHKTPSTTSLEPHH